MSSHEFVERGSILNINVGILGHVDSGKTSLVKSLSTSLSTAALDKNPQSQQRGITLDLGFSSFTLPMPEHLISSTNHQYDSIQFTLVDCPGHASLIRTIIGGAQIIDMILLVIDANKGIQTQTAECIVIGEITTDNMIVVMNKVDMLPENEREVRIERMTKRIRKIFASTKFANVPIVPTSAAIGGEKVASISAANNTQNNPEINNKSGSGGNSGSNNKFLKNSVASAGVDDLVDLIKRTVQLPIRNTDAPFYYAIDHCFAIKGHGTVLTGTVLSGTIAINQTIEIPHMQIQRKVKSLQMFRKPVRVAKQGDRVGICVTNLDPNSIERSVAAFPGSVPLLSSVICMVKKVRFFRMPCKSNTKFHVSIGHTTIIATAVFFGASELAALLAAKESISTVTSANTTSDSTQTTTTGISNNANSNNAKKVEIVNKQSALNATYQNNFPSDVDFSFSSDYQFQEEMTSGSQEESSVTAYGREPVQWVLLQFQQPVFCPIGSLVIASRLDADSTRDAVSGSASAHCRLAFYGPVRESLTEDEFDRVKIYSWKVKRCEVFRLTDVRNGLCFELIGWKLVSETGTVTPFLGMTIETETGACGTIVSSFGSGGKFRAKFPQGARVVAGGPLILRFKRYIYDKTKRMEQSGILSTVPNDDKDRDNSTENYLDSDEDHFNVSPQDIVLKPEHMALRGVAHDPREGVVARSCNRKNKAQQQPLQTPQPPQPSTSSQQTAVAANDSADGGVRGLANTLNATSLSGADYNYISTTQTATAAPISQPHMTTIVTTAGDVPTVPEQAVPISTATTVATPSTQSQVPQGRQATVESIKQEDGFTQAIVKGAFRMEENIKLFAGSVVLLGPGFEERGELIGPFGKMGKCKVKFRVGCEGLVVDATVIVQC